MSPKVSLFLLGCLLASIYLSTALSGNDKRLQTVIIRQVRSRLTHGGPNATTDEPPCDQTTNACMDWCGETVRRPGRCPDNQMCCLLIY